METTAESIDNVFHDGFDPTRKYGQAIDIPYDLEINSCLEEEVVLDVLRDLFEKRIPLKYVKNVQFRKHVFDYGRGRSVAWYYVPNQKGFIEKNGKWDRVDPMRGYYIWTVQ